MTINQFIEKAIEGGWENTLPSIVAKVADDNKEVFHADLATRLLWVQFFPLVALDVEAWKAVGKVEGWHQEKGAFMYYWQVQMHRMIDALAEGKSIEQYLETI